LGDDTRPNWPLSPKAFEASQVVSPRRMMDKVESAGS
jgi:hypothetical protein